MIKILSPKSNISIMKFGLRHYLVTTFILLFIPFLTYGQTVINMEKDGGVYKIPCEINGLRLKLIFDTGAANVCISGSIADMMLENGYLETSDIKGSGLSQVADGRIVDNTIINIKKLKIADVELNNVEAVVIHQQTAPLLLGQSAIQKLGSVSIHDNKLFINEFASSPVKQKTQYSQEEIDRLFDLAIEADNNGSNELAVEYYEILYSENQLSTYGKYRYADLLRVTKRYTESLPLYLEVTHKIQELSLSSQIWVYRGLQICYNNIGDNNSSIKYGQLALQMSNFATDCRKNIIFGIANSYYEMGNKYSCITTVNKEIEKYLNYMGIKATDCWDKEYKDPYLADMYYNLYLFAMYDSDYDKYTIISAAWGNKQAIENASKFNLSYNVKPTRYAY